ncbi:MAG: isoamylase early set domain-containing protein [Candidatus Eisenbacteria bacterium]|nr:isoamylase early set domain-containing protein [Candidatus Eisenbacteria bacterium]
MVRPEEDGRILFRFSCPERQGPVFLVGDFNGWSERRHPMERTPDGHWRIRIPLPPGRYAFKYLCRGDWYNDPQADAYRENAWGSVDSLISIPRSR